MKFLPINQAISAFSFGFSPGTGSVTIYSNNKVTHTPKIVMAAMSSNDEAAMSVVGIPFLVP